MFKELKAVNEIDKNLVEPQKRARSVRDRFSSKKECPWMFGFELKTVDRVYVLYAPNKVELSYWLRIFSILIQMNARGL